MGLNLDKEKILTMSIKLRQKIKAKIYELQDDVHLEDAQIEHTEF